MAKPAEVVVVSTLVGGKLHEVTVIVSKFAAHTPHTAAILMSYSMTWPACFVFGTLTTQQLISCGITMPKKIARMISTTKQHT